MPGPGPEFGADLHRLYQLGRVRLPQISEAFAEASQVHWAARSAIQGFANRLESPIALTTLLAMQYDLNYAAYAGAVRCSTGGEAVLAMVDDYVRTDAAALAEFERLMGLPENSRQYEEPTGPAPVARHPDEVPAPAPHPDGVY